MQTFLPYPDFYRSAQCLDWKYSHNRLNNQINEGIIIAQSLLGLLPEGKGYEKHPAVKMWRGYEFQLLEYVGACIGEWTKRQGVYKNEDQRYKYFVVLIDMTMDYPQDLPPWISDEKFHSAHRSILLAKLPSWYSQFGWTEQPAQRDPITNRWPYIWPVK